MSPGRRRRLRLWLGRGCLGLSTVASLGVIGVIGAFFYARTAAGNALVKDLAVGVLNDIIDGHVEVGGLSTDLLSGATLTGVALEDAAGTPVARIAEVSLTFELLSLTSGTLAVPTARVRGLDATLVVGRDGSVNVLRALSLPPGIVRDLPIGIDIAHAEVDGRLVVDAGGLVLPIEDIGLTTGLSLHRDLDLHGLDLRARPARLADPLTLKGGLRWDGDTLAVPGLRAETGRTALGLNGAIGALFGAGAFDVAVEPLAVDLDSLPDFAALGLTVRAEGSARISGTWRALGVRADLTAPSPITVDLGASLSDPDWPFTLGAEVDRLSLDALHRTIPAGTRASARVDLRGHLRPGALEAAGTLAAREIDALNLRFDGLSARLALDGERLLLTDGRVEGEAGTATLSGELAPILDPRVRLDVSAALGLAALAPVGVPAGLDGRADARLAIDGRLLSEGARVSGGLDLVDVTFRGLAIPRARLDLEGRVSEALELQAGANLDVPRVTGRGVDLVGITAPLPVTWRPHGPLRASGSGSVASARFADWASVDGARARFELAAAPRSPLSASATVILPNPRASALTLGDVTATARLLGDQATASARVELPELDAPFDLDLALNLADGSVVVSRAQVTPRATGAAPWALTRPATARLTERGIEGLDLDLGSEAGGEARVTGGLGFDGLALTVTADKLHIDQVRDWLPTLGLPKVEGQIAVQADVSGKDRLSLDARFRGTRLGLIDGLGGLDLDGTLQLDATRGHLSARLLHEGLAIARVTGSVGLEVTPDSLVLSQTDPVDLRVEVHEIPLARAAAVSRNERLVKLARDYAEGTLGGEVVLRGRVDHIQVEGGLQAALAGPARTLLADVTLAGDTTTVVVGGGVRDPELGRLIALNGEVGTGVPHALRWLSGATPRPELRDPAFWVPRVELGATVQDLPAAHLFRLLDRQGDIAGSFNGGVRLVGSGLVYKPAASLTWTEGRLGPTTTVRGLAVSLDGAGDLTVDASFQDEQPRRPGARRTVVEEGGLVVRGRLPLAIDLADPPAAWLSEAVDLTFSGRGLPVAVATAVDPEIADPVGWLGITGTVRGTPRAPDLDLHLRMAGASARYRALGVRATDLDLVVDVVGDTITIDTLRLQTEAARRQLGSLALGEGIQASGTARILDLDVRELDITATVDQSLVLSRRSQVARISTTDPLRVTGRALRPVVQGGIVVDQADVDLDKGTLMEAGLWLRAPSQLDPRIRLVRADAVVDREIRDERPFWAPITADLSVDLGRNLRGGLALPYLEGFGAVAAEASTIQAGGTLAGSVRVQTADGVASVAGDVELLRGDAKVVRSHFILDGGTVQFLDNDPFQPFVNATGSMSLETGGSVDMGIRGTPVQADVRFTSSSLKSADLVLAAVITGRVPSTGGSQVSVASSLASAVVTKALFGELDLGNLQWSEGRLYLDVSVGDRLRLAPQLGVSNNQDFLGMQVAWFPSSALMLDGFLGTQRQSIGFGWRKRY